MPPITNPLQSNFRNSDVQAMQKFRRPRRSLRDPSATNLEGVWQLLGIELNVLRPWLLKKDEDLRIAGLGHCVAALAGYLSGDGACILRNHLETCHSDIDIRASPGSRWRRDVMPDSSDPYLQEAGV